MLKIFPIAVVMLLDSGRLPALGSKRGRGASHHRGRGSDRADPGQDTAHHRHRPSGE